MSIGKVYWKKLKFGVAGVSIKSGLLSTPKEFNTFEAMADPTDEGEPPPKKKKVEGEVDINPSKIMGVILFIKTLNSWGFHGMSMNPTFSDLVEYMKGLVHFFGYDRISVDDPLMWMMTVATEENRSTNKGCRGCEFVRRIYTWEHKCRETNWMVPDWDYGSTQHDDGKYAHRICCGCYAAKLAAFAAVIFVVNGHGEGTHNRIVRVFSINTNTLNWKPYYGTVFGKTVLAILRSETGDSYLNQVRNSEDGRQCLTTLSEIFMLNFPRH